MLRFARSRKSSRRRTLVSKKKDDVPPTPPSPTSEEDGLKSSLSSSPVPSSESPPSTAVGAVSGSSKKTKQTVTAARKSRGGGKKKTAAAVLTDVNGGGGGGRNKNADNAADDDVGGGESSGMAGNNDDDDDAAAAVTPSTCDDPKKQAALDAVYRTVRKCTGTLGGNGCGGAIYGELTQGSMQKMVNLMKLHCGLDETSLFMDIGAGLGKPNFTVAQDPGVKVSYGIELEPVRWQLSLHNLKHVLNQADTDEYNVRQGNVVFAVGDITDCTTFDPFTHIYMFDIGFPPALFHFLSRTFNKSSVQHLVCFHHPRLMVERYGFDVELVKQEQTSMHGSAEGHMCYIYRKKQETADDAPAAATGTADSSNKSSAKTTARRQTRRGANKGKGKAGSQQPQPEEESQEDEKENSAASHNSDGGTDSSVEEEDKAAAGEADPLFASSLEMIRQGPDAVRAWVEGQLEVHMSGRRTRRQTRAAEQSV